MGGGGSNTVFPDFYELSSGRNARQKLDLSVAYFP